MNTYFKLIPLLQRDLNHSLIALLAFVSLLPTEASATTFYVDPVRGNDSNNGLSTSAPFLTINRALDGSASSAMPGDTVYLRGGIYRGADVSDNTPVANVTVKANGTDEQPITVAAYAGERPILKGSQIANGWTLVTGTEFTSNNFPTAGIGHIYKIEHWWCDANKKLRLNPAGFSYQCNPQQVFASNSETNDGVALTQISWPTSTNTTVESERFPKSGTAVPVGFYFGIEGSLSNMVAGSFYYVEVKNTGTNADVSTVYVWLPNGGDPNTNVMEISVSTFLINPFADANSHGGDYINWKNLAFRHSNKIAWGKGAGSINIGQGSILDNCDIQWLDEQAVAVGTDGLMQGCRISNIGRLGFTLGEGAVADSCYISGCNYRNFNMFWDCGGIKNTHGANGVTIENCEFTGNFGPSIWFDFVDDTNGPPNFVQHNYLHNNIPFNRLEWVNDAHTNTQIVRTMIQVVLEASRNVIVYNNLIVSNVTGSISLQGAQNCRIYNNIIMNMDSDWMGDGQHPWFNFGVLDSWGRPCQDNQIYNNIFLNNSNCFVVSVRLNSGLNAQDFNVCDYNLYYNSNPSNTLGFYYTSLLSLSAWQAFSGYDLHSIIRDPQLAGRPINMEFARSDFNSIIDGATRSYDATMQLGLDTRLGTTEDGITTINTSLTGLQTQVDSRLNLAGGTLSGTLQLPSGSASAPSLTFNGNPNTGIYNSQANEIGFATAGSAKWFINSAGTLWAEGGNGLWTSGTIMAGSGAAHVPSHTFSSDQTMGMYRADTNDLRFSVGREDQFKITTNTVEILHSARVVEAITNDNLTPRRALVAGANKDLQSSPVTTTELGYLSGVTSGIQAQLDSKLSSSAQSPSGSAQFAAGSVGAPSITFSGDTNTGIYHPQTGAIGLLGNLSVAGSQSVSGNALFSADVSMGGKLNVGNLGVQSSLNASNLTANRALVSDTGKNITNSSVTLAELDNVSGVTNNIQTQLNGKATETVVTAQTTNSTTTTLTTFPAAAGETVQVNASVLGTKSDGTQASAYVLSALFLKNGSIRQVGSTKAISIQEDVSSWNATLDTDGANIRVRVAGAAGTTIKWKVKYQIARQ
jgi:hypothetical protein